MPVEDFFYRVESPTQTSAIALQQAASSEIWGSTPRGGFVPTVQAYAGKLHKDDRGIEFTTPIAPHPNGSPFEARWYLNITAGVVLRQQGGTDYACITATVDNRQP